MRFFIALILIIVAVFYFLPERESKPVEETFIGDEIKALQNAQDFEADYLDATRDQQERLEKELEEASGG